MTVDIFEKAASYTVQGVGPYQIPHPYAEGAIVAHVVIDGVAVPLGMDAFSVVPSTSITSGNLFLPADIAALHNGRVLWIDRDTISVQIWEARYGDREVGIEKQLDRDTMGLQEVRDGLTGAVRVRGKINPVVPENGRTLIWSAAAGGFIVGPNAEDISSAQGYAYAARKDREAASHYAPAYYKDPSEMFASDSTWPIGTRINARTGEVWDVVTVGSADVIHPVSGIGIVVAGDTTSASDVGAPATDDPSRREPFAPALVASMQARQLYGVTLRDLLDRNYSGTKDGAGPISGFLPELASAGIAIRDPHGVRVLCEEPIRPQSKMQLLLSPATVIMKAWTSASSDTNALIARADFAVNTDDFLIDGGIWRPVDPSFAGRIMTFWGDRWNIRNAFITGFQGSQAIVFGGDDNRMSNVRAISYATAFGTGVYRMLGGDNFLGYLLIGMGGDDIFQFVQSTNSTNPRYNKSISNSFYVNCYGVSASARLMVAAIAGPQNENAMTCTTRNSGWINVHGKGGSRCLVVENTEGDGTVQDQIDNIIARDCVIDASDEDLVQSQSINVLGDFAGAIGKVLLENVELIGSKRNYGMSVASEGAIVTLDNCRLEGETHALEITKPASVVLRDGRYRVKDNGGGHGEGHVVAVQAAAGAASLEVHGSPKFADIPAGLAGIRLSSSTARLLQFGRATFAVASDDTGTDAISGTAGSMITTSELAYNTDGGVNTAGIWKSRGEKIATTLTQAAHTASEASLYRLNRFQRGTPQTFTLPTDASEPNIPIGGIVEVSVTGVGAVTIVAEAGATVTGRTTPAQFDRLMIQKTAANTYVVTGA